MVPDLAGQLAELEGREDLDAEAERSRSATRSTARYASKNERIHNVQALLKAYALFEKDVEYVVQDGKVMIVDEFTGRLMPGPPLLGRPAPGDRGQGRRARRGRDADARHHHAAELLPHVREAGRHDRHRRDRGARVLGDLQARRLGDPDAPAGARAWISTTSSTAPSARSTTPWSTRSPSCTRRASRCWSARSASR